MANLQEKVELKSLISEYCSERGISKAEFGVKADVSPATLSAIENEKWDKISASMVRKLKAFLEEKKANAIFKTTDFESVVKLCCTAQKHHLMIGLIGDTGTGKTTSLAAFSLRQNVYRITFEKSMNPTRFFAQILKELGVDFYGSLYTMVDRVAEELNKKDQPLLVIDEAGKLTHPAILYLHDLREKTKYNCGVVLAGMPYFKNNLQRCTKLGKEGYGEFLRRINLWHELNGLSASEIKYIASNSGITDNGALRELSAKRRFGDLMNEILLAKVEMGEL